MISKILGTAFKYDAEDPKQATHWVNVNSDNSGIKRIRKSNTTSVTIHNEHYMLKFLNDNEAKRELDIYTALINQDVPVPIHRVVQCGKCKMLIRGPTTAKSIGDIVYAHFENLEGAPQIPDKANSEETAELQESIEEQFKDVFSNLDAIREWCYDNNVQMPITLDNIDLHGKLYDFGDYNTAPHNVDIALADFMRYYSLAHIAPPECTKKWFPYYTNLKELSYLDKVLQINNNLLHATQTDTELFIDGQDGSTGAYYNQVTGFLKINKEALTKVTEFTENLYKLQDPAFRIRNYKIAVSECLTPTADCKKEKEAPHKVTYDSEGYQFFEEHHPDIDQILKYTYFQGKDSDTRHDVYFYDYQGRLFLQPHLLKFLYERTLKDFEACRTNKRFAYDDCRPRNSSLGASHPTIRQLKQKAVYNAAPDTLIDEIVELSASTPLIFTTKIIQKFALTCKSRARTVAACSMFSSTLFRALHKPVTAEFVRQAQKPGGKIHHLIGVSKFHKGFDKFFTSRYGDIENWNIFGSDYTKCDRSFPFVLRCAAAAILFELGDWEHNTNHFTNEVHAFIFDMLEAQGHVYCKPGGTSSGDATTAFANTLYNHMVHLLVQLQSLVTMDVDPKHQALKTAAVKLWQTGDATNYNTLLDIYNTQSYRFNFLSDDSFILTDRHDPTLPDIFNCHNFSKKLETIIHTIVDEKKSWFRVGEIHEFCSSEIRKVNGRLEYIPDKYRLLAALLITGKPIPDDLDLVRIAAILSEAAVYYYVDPVYWQTLWSYYYHRQMEFLKKYNTLPLPDCLCYEDFYLSLLEDDPNSTAEKVIATVCEDYDIQLQKSEATKICFTCSNPTVSTCEQCPVPYPLCAYCAYQHYTVTQHKVTHLPKCTHQGCLNNEPDEMYYTLEGAGFTTKCHDHITAIAIPVVDEHSKCFKLPLNQQCIKHETSAIEALNATIDTFGNSTLFQWDEKKSHVYNCTKLIHDSNLLDQYSEDAEELYDYSVEDNLTLHIPGSNYGPTTYCTIYDDQGRQKMNCTLDPLPNQRYKITCLENTLRFMKYSKIRRTQRQLTITRPAEFDRLKKATFILGPPGTGKTTHFKTNYFTKASEFNRVIYTAPTHKLIQDMDEELATTDYKDNITVLKSKFNNRTYHAAIDDPTKPIHLTTINTVRPTAGATLLVDEVSLITPKNLIEAVIRSNAAAIIIVGDPFQLSPVTPLANFKWDYNTFYLRHMTDKFAQKELNTCYRCPRNIFNTFAGAYHKANIKLEPAKEGGIFQHHAIQDRGPEVSLEVLQQAQELNPDTILTNYRAAVTLASANNINAVTIDSAQGLTVKHVAIIIFGSTPFSKVINRLIVALSRATERVDLFCTNYMMHYITTSISTEQLELQKVNLTKPCNLKQIELEQVAKQVEATAVCDIEFFHIKDKDSETANFLGLGEVNVLTSRQATVYMRPHYNRDGKYYLGTDSNTFARGFWKYMMKHLPEAHEAPVRVNTLLQFLNETTDLTDAPLTFILFNGTNDLDALAEITNEQTQCTTCTKQARFYSTRGPVCQQHAKGETLTHIAGGQYFMIESNKNLQTTHDMLCGTYHGTAHSASVDVTMTACLLATLLTPLMGKEQITNNGFIKVQFSTQDKRNRLYGNTLFCDGQVITTRFNPMPITMPPPQDHSDDYVIRPVGLKVPSCHPTSTFHICTKCRDAALAWFKHQITYNQKGYQAVSPLLQLSPTEKQLKLTAELVDTPMGTMLKLGPDSGKIYHIQEGLDMTIRKAANEKSWILPVQSVFTGLGITCTVGFSTSFVPCRTEDELTPWDLPLSYTELKTCPRYIRLYNNPAHGKEDFSAFTIGLSKRVMVNTIQIERYQLVEFRNQQPHDLPETLKTTGRLDNLSFLKFNGEETTYNQHIQEGEVHGTKIGGNHLFPCAFDNTQFDIRQIPNRPLWHATIAKATGTKIYNSVTDVHAREFITAVEKLITSNTISTKTTISIDYNQMPIMIWAADGIIQTAYLQAGGADRKASPVAMINSHYELYVPTIQPIKDIQQILETNPKAIFKGDPPSPINIHKYVQICHFINDNAVTGPNPKVLHVGACSGEAYNNMSVGGVVLEHFFRKGQVKHYDLLDTNTANGRMQIGNTGMYNLIISDIWAEGDNTTLLKQYANDNLTLGGSIIWKTTRLSYITAIDAISKAFGQTKFFNVKCNSNSSEIFVAFLYKGCQIKELHPDKFDKLLHIHAQRCQYVNTITYDTLDIETIHKPKPQLQIEPWLATKINVSQWQSGRFSLQC